MTLDPRCKELLCGLAPPVLTELNTVLSTIEVTLSATLIGLAATLNVLNIALLPLEAGRAAVDAVFAEAQQVADLVPVALLLDCIGVGDTYGGVALSVAEVQATVDTYLDNLNQKLAFKSRLKDQIAAYEAAVASINDFQIEIAGCLELLP